MNRSVVIVDASHIYMGARHVLGLPAMRPNRRAMLETLRLQLAELGVSPWRIMWMDACATFYDRFDLEDLELEEGVFVRLGEVVRDQQKMVDGLVAQAIQQAGAWPGVSAIYVVAGDTDYIPFVREAVDAGISMYLLHLEGSTSATPLLKRTFDGVRTLDPEGYRDHYTQFEDLSAISVTRATWEDLVEKLGWEDAKSASTEALQSWAPLRNTRIPDTIFSSLGRRMSMHIGKNWFEPEELPIAIAAWWRGVDRASAI